jgi:hypothetical protein
MAGDGSRVLYESPRWWRDTDVATGYRATYGHSLATYGDRDTAHGGGLATYLHGDTDRDTTGTMRPRSEHLAPARAGELRVRP